MSKSLKQLKEFYKAFQNSKNKVYFFINNREIILVVLASIAATTGLLGYIISKDSTGLEIINNTISLFILSWANDDSWILDIAKVFALLTIFSGVVAIYLSKKMNALSVKKVQKNPYTLLVGLGTQNSSFLDNLEDNTTSTIVIESDNNNTNIEQYQQKGFGVISAKAEDVIGKLELDMLQNAVISTGNDRQNIAIAIELMHSLKGTQGKRIFVRIENRDLSVLFKQNVVKTSNDIDVITYSLYENMAKELFSRHTILGLQAEIIKTNKAYNIVLVGSSTLAAEIIYHLAILANLPEENKLNLYLVDAEVKKFYAHVKKLFAGIESIPQLNIKPLELNSDTLDFYQDKVWNKRNLTNIIIATGNEEKNLDIAINLQDTTYPEQTAKGTFKTKVLLAIYNNLGLGRDIDEDKKAFANFYTFADISKASSPKNLINEELDTIAKLIHNAYLGEDEVSVESLNAKWMSKDESSPHKRASNRAQALHIDTKLLALGLKRKESDRSLKERLLENEKVFKEIFPEDKRVKEFPESFDTMLSKLAKSEHNRWNAFHYSYGWKHDVNRNDEAKRHPCLLPFSKFDTDELKDTYQWDVDSILNIPVYLAHAGYELVKAEDA